MPKTVGRIHARVWWRSGQLVLVLIGLAVALVTTVENRWARARASGDRGSESVSKAVITAIALALAVGLGAAITAVVKKYQGQLQ